MGNAASVQLEQLSVSEAINLAIEEVRNEKWQAAAVIFSRVLEKNFSPPTTTIAASQLLESSQIVSVATMGAACYRNATVSLLNELRSSPSPDEKVGILSKCQANLEAARAIVAAWPTKPSIAGDIDTLAGVAGLQLGRCSEHGRKSNNRGSASPAQRRRRKPSSGWVRPSDRQAEDAVLDPPSRAARGTAKAPQPRSASSRLPGASSAAVPPRAFTNHEGSFERCPWPAAGDWLDEHNERGQTFAQFARLSLKAVPHGTCRVVEIVPVGPFNIGGGGSSWAEGNGPDLGLLVEYCGLFFGCAARLATKPISLADVCHQGIGEQLKAPPEIGGARQGPNGQLQLECADVFRALQAGRRPRGVLVRVAVTMADLYPVKEGEAWNFVSGQAKAMVSQLVFGWQPRKGQNSTAGA